MDHNLADGTYVAVADVCSVGGRGRVDGVRHPQPGSAAVCKRATARWPAREPRPRGEFGCIRADRKWERCGIRGRYSPLIELLQDQFFTLLQPARDWFATAGGNLILAG